MSLVGFKARNHPQQTIDPNVDDRAITPSDFAPLHEPCEDELACLDEVPFVDPDWID